MPIIHVCRAAHLYPFTDFCQTNGLSTAESFRRYKLPTLLDYSDGIYIPWEATCRAIEDITLRQGVQDFSARCVIDKQLGDFGEALESAVISSPTLHIALCKTKVMLKSENTTLNMTWGIKNDICWLKMSTVDMHFEANAWSNFMFMLSMLREFLGANWQPSNIVFSDSNKPSNFIKSYFPNSQFTFTPFSVGFAFPAATLSQKPLRFRSNTLNSEELKNFKDLQNNSILYTRNLVKGLMLAYTEEKPPQLNELANILDKSSRTIQRTLKNNGLSYANILDDIRFEKASSLLTDPNIKIADISNELGYASTSHFIRSFKRITNTTPQKYRKENLFQPE